MNEAVDVWRPVKAVHVRDDIYVVADRLRADEMWEFGAGRDRGM